MNIDSNRPPFEVANWDELARYVKRFNGNAEKKLKICAVNQEKQEIRIQNKDDLDLNAKCALDRGLSSLKLIIYIDEERKYEVIYCLNKTKPNLSATKTSVFPVDKLQNLKENVLADKWYIPVKLNEALGVCLTSAIQLAQEGRLDIDGDCQQFIETIVPDAFRKLQTTQSVLSWPREIQCGTFDMIELLVDLVGTRIRYPSVPITLLNTLAITFDTSTTFSQKHKDEQLPTRRSYSLDDEQFLRTNFNGKTGSYGWIRSFIQRFIAQNGLKNLRNQFENLRTAKRTATTTMEYNCLLKLFSKCYQCIDAQRFRTLFIRSIRQAIKYHFETKKTSGGSNAQLQELYETLIELCFNYDMKEDITAILELSSIPDNDEISSASAPMDPLLIPFEQMNLTGKVTEQEKCERLVEETNSLTINIGDAKRKDPLSSLSSSGKRVRKRKHRGDGQHRASKKESKRSSTIPTKTYDRSNPDEILGFFTPMKLKISALYDQLHTATCNGSIREVLKIEEKLKLLRPYSARFVADENTSDGTIIEPGQVFRKTWILLNDGCMPWSNDDIQLINLADGIKVVKQPIIPVTAPHDRALISVDFMSSDQAGTYDSKWILSFRHQTFGPIVWCSIVVNSSTTDKTSSSRKETFELVDIPLPACFDLSKPYQSTSNSIPYYSTVTMTRSSSSDSSSNSSVLSPTKSNEMSIIDVTHISASASDKYQPELESKCSKNLIDVDSSWACPFTKPADSTIQAKPKHEQEPVLVRTTAAADVDDSFEHIDCINSSNQSSYLSNDPMVILSEMGFVNQLKNQRLLAKFKNDLNKVIEVLTNGTDIHFN